MPSASTAQAPPPAGVTGELRRLMQHSSHYLAGLVAGLGLGFVSFPIYTRAFSVADYGTIDFVQRILLLLTAPSKAGLQNAAVRFYNVREFENDPEAARRFYSTMFFGIAGTSSAVAILFLVTMGLLPKSLFDTQLDSLLWFIPALLLLKALSSMLASFLRVEERTKAYNVVTVGSRASTIAAVCGLLVLSGPSAAVFFIGATVVESGSVLILISLLLRRRLLYPSRFDRALFRVGVAFGLPLIVYEVATIVLDSGDRFLVRHYLGAEALGLYSVAYGMSSYLNGLLITPINLALTPIYMRLWFTEGREKTIQFLTIGLDLFLMAAAGAQAVAAVSCRDAITLLASSKYHAAGPLIPVIVAGLLVYTTHAFLCAGLLIQKKTLTMARLLLYSAVLNIVLNCLLLPRMGLQAAALATLISYVFCILLLARASFKVLPLNIRLRTLAVYAFAAVVAWYGGSHLELDSRVLNFVGKSALTVALYVGVLYLLDSRVRAVPELVMRWMRHRRDHLAAEAAVVPTTEQ